MKFLLLCALVVCIRCETDFLTQLQHMRTFKHFVQFVNNSGLAEGLLAADNLTVFAPSDEAIENMPGSFILDITTDPEKMKDFIRYHVTTGGVYRTNVQQDQEIATELGVPVRVNKYTNQVISVEGVALQRHNVKIVNGFLHCLAGVLIPPEGNLVDLIAQKENLQLFSSLLNETGVDLIINDDHNITVFAPSDDAVNQMSDELKAYLHDNPNKLEQLVKYHVIDRMTLYSVGMTHSLSFPSADSRHDGLIMLEQDDGADYINHARITEKDISGTNGVLHVIDHILVPPRVGIELEKEGFGVVVG